MNKLLITLVFSFFLLNSYSQDHYIKLPFIKIGCPTIILENNIIANETALILASQNDKFECIQILTQTRGIDVNARDNGQYNALSWTIENGFVNSLQTLINIMNRRNAIDFNEQNGIGDNLLHHAARLGQTNCVQILTLAHGMNINAKNSQGYTALHLAILNGKIDCVRLLTNATRGTLYLFA